MFSGLLESGQLYLKFDEAVHEGMRLGRNMWLDGRSLAHMVENDVQEMGMSLKSCEWERVLTVLDQGQLGSCTGNAGTGALGTQPFYDAVGSAVLPKPDDAAGAEEFAVQLYADATVVDGYPGVYPPDDTGSSGLAICKVLKSRDTINGYRWARTAYGFLRLLQRGPVLQGNALVQRVFLARCARLHRLRPELGIERGRRWPRNRGGRRRARHHRCVQQRDHLRQQLGRQLGGRGPVPDAAADLRAAQRGRPEAVPHLTRTLSVNPWPDLRPRHHDGCRHQGGGERAGLRI